jgi:pimeloyl-ACP methyl ester carboxylesterase
VIEKKTHFYSDGLKLDAAFYVADKPDPKKPLLVINSGFTGMMHIHPARFARGLTPHGYSVFAFDYRGFARARVSKAAYGWKTRCATSSTAFSTPVKTALDFGTGIVLAGWAMAGGLGLQAALHTQKLRGIIALNGFYDAIRVQKALRGEAGWEQFQTWLAAERSKSLASTRKPDLDPFAIYPLDPSRKSMSTRCCARLLPTTAPARPWTSASRTRSCPSAPSVTSII